MVINFDVPFTAETYFHRIGRAGRFGKASLNEKINFIRKFRYFKVDTAPLSLFCAVGKLS